MTEHVCHKPPVLAFRLQAGLHILVFLRFLAERLVMVQPPKTPLHCVLFFYLCPLTVVERSSSTEAEKTTANRGLVRRPGQGP